jgi:ribonuclease P protein component
MDHVRPMRNSPSRHCDDASADVRRRRDCAGPHGFAPKMAPGLTSPAAGPYKPRDRGHRASFMSRQPSPSLRSASGETHLPTIAARPQAAPRLSRPHGDEGRPEGACAAESQGAQAPVGLTPYSVTAIGRLKIRREFLYVRDGTRYAARSLVLQARARAAGADEDPHLARFGFTASKTLGGAVVRNRARRRLKEAVRLTGPSQAMEGYDYVLIAREGTVQRPFTALIKDLERAFAKVHAPSPAKRR